MLYVPLIQRNAVTVMMRITHAILHAFDFEGGASYPSERELDLGSRPVKSYVQRCMRKLASSVESRHGTFSRESSFGGALERYARGGSLGFVELSQQLAAFLWEELRRCDDLEQCDLLVVDFTDTRDLGSGPAATAQATVAPTTATTPVKVARVPAPSLGGEDLSERFFGAALLPRRRSFVHDLRSDGSGAPSNEILRQDCALPNPTQKLDSYLLVNLATGAIDFHDKPRSQAGSEVDLIANHLLACSAQASARQAMQTVERIVEEVAQQYGEHAPRAVAQAKHAVAASAEREEAFSPAEVGRQVFERRPELQERYESALGEASLPDEVPMRRTAANRIAKNHRIKTDTGIEISFPSEYAADANFIEFTADDEGRVSILIKNVGRIENK